MPLAGSRSGIRRRITAVSTALDSVIYTYRQRLNSRIRRVSTTVLCSRKRRGGAFVVNWCRLDHCRTVFN